MERRVAGVAVARQAAHRVVARRRGEPAQAATEIGRLEVGIAAEGCLPARAQRQRRRSHRGRAQVHGHVAFHGAERLLDVPGGRERLAAHQRMNAVARVAVAAQHHRAGFFRAVARVELDDGRGPHLAEIAEAVRLLLVQQRVVVQVLVRAVLDRRADEEREGATERQRQRRRERELVLLRLEDVRLRVAAGARLVAEAVVAGGLDAGGVTVPAPIPAPVLGAELRAVVGAERLLPERPARSQSVPARVRVLAEAEGARVGRHAHECAEVAAVGEPGREERVAPPVARRDPGRLLGGWRRGVLLAIEVRARSRDELGRAAVAAQARAAALRVVNHVMARSADDSQHDAVRLPQRAHAVVAAGEVHLHLARLAVVQRPAHDGLAQRLPVRAAGPHPHARIVLVRTLDLDDLGRVGQVELHLVRQGGGSSGPRPRRAGRGVPAGRASAARRRSRRTRRASGARPSR